MKLNRLLKSCLCVLAACLALGGGEAKADATYHNLGGGDFTQDWSNAGLITVNNDWSAVPSLIGYGGNDLTAATGTDPQTILVENTGGLVLNVLANQTATTSTSGGLGEFAITNPTVAFQGSGTSDAPHLKLHLNTTGRQSVTVSYRLRDVDGTTDNSVQPVALQYRVGTTGAFTNVPAAFVADASTGPSIATAEATVTVTLPAAVNNQAQVELRIMTANAAGNDEWIGIDDILVVSSAMPIPVITSPVAGATGVFTMTYGVASAVQTFGVAGTDLTAPIVATAPTGFEVSGDGTTWGGTASFAPASGVVTGATLSVRLKADAAVSGSYDNVVIPLTSTGAAEVNLTTPATGSSVAAAGLTIAASPVSKALGSVLTDVNLGSLAFTPTGLVNGELVGSVTVTYMAGFAAGDAAQVYPGAVVPSAAVGGTFTASNYTITYMPADLTVTPDPTLTLVGTFTVMGAEYGSATVAQSFTVSGGR